MAAKWHHGSPGRKGYPGKIENRQNFILFPLDIYTAMGLLDHMAALF